MRTENENNDIDIAGGDGKKASAMPNFSFSNEDQLREVPTVALTADRRDDNEWKPVMEFSDSDDTSLDERDYLSEDVSDVIDDIPEEMPEVISEETADEYEEAPEESEKESEEKDQIWYKADEEADRENDEKENNEEQHAVGGESADSLGESEARHDSGGKQAEKGFQGAEGDGFLEAGGDSADGRGEEEAPADGAGSGEERGGADGTDAGRGREGSEKGEAGEESEKATGETSGEASEEDAEDEDTFDGAEEIEETVVSKSSRIREKLRREASQGRRKLISDDETFTVVQAVYLIRTEPAKANTATAENGGHAEITRLSHIAAISGMDMNNDGGVTDVPEAAAPQTVGERKAGNGEKQLSGDAQGSKLPHIMRVVPENGFSDSDVRFSEEDFNILMNQSGNAPRRTGASAEAPADAAESASGADENRTVIPGGARKRDDSPDDFEDFAPDADLDYKDIFQDDPYITNRRRRSGKVLRVLGEILKDILIFIIVFVVIVMGYLTWTVYVSRTNYVYGSSMEPTLHNEEKVKTTLLPYIFGKPEVGDIVIIDISRKEKKFGYFDRIGEVLKNNTWIRDNIFKEEEQDTLYIKRIVAVGGDRIEFRDDKFYRNGEQVVEDYIMDQTVTTYPNGAVYDVPEGYIFVMGDNRNVSKDSRSSEVGLVPVYLITGKLK